MGGYGSGGRVHKSEDRWFDPRVWLHVALSLSKILTPKLHLVTAASLCECMCEMADLRNIARSFG